MNRSIRPLVRRAAAESAVIAAALSPLPFADEVALVPFYGLLSLRIGRRRGVRFTRVPWRPIGITVAKGLAARGVVSLGIAWVPGVDAVVNAATAASLTEVLGPYIDHVCAHPSRARPLEFRVLVEALKLRRATEQAQRRRVRIGVPGLLGNPALGPRVEQKLRELSYVRRVKVNPHSGRALVVLERPYCEVANELERVMREVCPPNGRTPPTVREMGRKLGRRAKSALSGTRRWLTRAARRAPAQPTHPELSAPWHSMTIDQVVEALDTDPNLGLSRAEATDRKRRYGQNILSGIRRRTRWEIFRGELINLPNGLLVLAIALSAASGDALEAGAIVLVLGSNVVIGYFSEAKAEDLLVAWGKLRAEWATVVREGTKMTIQASELVPGDVVYLTPGVTIAADARIIEADDFSVDESTLTGESQPVEKTTAPSSKDAAVADRTSVVYAGTVVATGRGKAIVFGTGDMTEIGALQRSLSRTEQRAAPLERQLDDLGRRLAALSLGASFVVTGLGIIRRQPGRILVRRAVALGVAAIPEGFPAVGTTALALASQRLQREGIIIRRLAAAETLGAVSVVCADKTGTLTENRMRVAEILLADRRLARIEWLNGHFRMVDAEGGTVRVDVAHDLARIAALNADVEINDAGEITQASGTEKALVEFAMAAGYPVRSRRRSAKRVGETRRSAESPMMTTIHEHPELGRIELAKGAPEEIVPRCGDLTPAEADQVMQVNGAMASRGLRVLGFAWRNDPQKPLVFAGLIGLRDPLRPHVRRVVETFARAGVRTLMLTGDQHRTAAAIGAELGLGPDAVYSRVTPAAKLDIVKELQRGGEIVAMTGDGVNDGPALKAADVGIAMGERGTDLARAVADVVLAKDDLSSLVLAMSEGRTLYDNVRRAIDYLVATNMSEVGVMLVGALFGVSPLVPLHLLWINILTDIAPALALAVEPPEPNVMERPPRDPDTALFGRADYRRLGVRSGIISLGALSSYTLGVVRSRSAGPYASTMAFTSLVTAQILDTRNHASTSAADSHWVPRVVLASLGVQSASLAHPTVRSVLGNVVLRPADLAASALLGILSARLGGRPFSFGLRDEIIGVRRDDRSLGTGGVMPGG